MDRLRSCLAALVAAAALVTPASAEAFEVRRCINLGNDFDAPARGEWGYRIARRHIEAVAAAGFDTVRLPVRWSLRAGPGPDHQIAPAFFAEVDAVIDQALGLGLQVVLDVHHFDELNQDPEANRAKLLAMWAQIAEHYKDYPQTLYFEPINEPNGAFQGDIMRQALRDVVEVIRRTNPTRVIILGGDHWSNVRNLDSLPDIDDPNIVHTFHFYDPFAFTHQKASWTELANSPTVRWGSDSDFADMADAMDLARTHAEATGRKIFIGEMGAFDAAPEIDAIDWLSAARQYAEGHGFGWCVWNFSSSFKMFDTDTNAWNKDKLWALGLVEEPTPEFRAKVESDAAASTIGDTADAEFDLVTRLLPRAGELMVLPYADRYDSYGDLSRRKTTSPGMPGGDAVEIRVTKDGGNPWDAGLTTSLPAIKAGEAIVIAFTARAVSGTARIGRVGVQQASPPYPEAFGATAMLDETPSRIIVSGVAARDYAAGEAGLFIQVAGVAQTLHLGPVFVFTLGRGVDPSALP